MIAMTTISSVTDLAVAKTDDLIDVCMDWRVLAGLLAFYLVVSKPLVVFLRDGFGVDPKVRGGREGEEGGGGNRF